MGVRRVLTGGLLLVAASVALLARLPLHGHYFRDIFPGFVLGGAGLGLSFVPVTIASLTGVERANAGIASGLVNTSRQVGGAIGLAAASAIAAASTSRYAHSHLAAAATSGRALDHGFQTTLYVLAAVAVAGALIAAGFIEGPRPRREDAEPVEQHAIPAFEEAA